jgi:hypothetical protein
MTMYAVNSKILSVTMSGHSCVGGEENYNDSQRGCSSFRHNSKLIRVENKSVTECEFLMGSVIITIIFNTVTIITTTNDTAEFLTYLLRV